MLLKQEKAVCIPQSAYGIQDFNLGRGRSRADATYRYSLLAKRSTGDKVAHDNI
jgi:hypothetical protein